MIKRILFILLTAISVTYCFAQTEPPGLKPIISAIDTFNKRIPAEKLYLHFDKPYYTTGDTLWFKAYLLDESFLTPSLKSGIIYVEIANDTNKVLMRRMVPVYSGTASGNIALLTSELPEGSYFLTAYTNVMRNFGETFFFKRSFYISGVTSQSWMVASKSFVTKEENKDKMNLNLMFSKTNKDPVGLKDMQVRIIAGKKTLLRNKVRTKSDGELDLSFDLPAKGNAQNVFLVAQDIEKGKTQQITIPVTVNRPENIDVQFMPEGGNLVSNTVNRIAFKAIGEDGKGIDISGIVSTTGMADTAVLFKSTHAGMGSFYFFPKTGKSYTAKIQLHDGSEKTYPLPAVTSTGTSLSVLNNNASDSLQISIVMPAGEVGKTYYLIGQSGSAVACAAVVRKTARIVISKKLFFTGVARFTLFNETKQPLNERLVYINHHDNLTVNIIPDKNTYKTRDSVALAIEVKDAEGKPVQGNFSMAITDDASYRRIKRHY
jgi:hypothetical protein